MYVCRKILLQNRKVFHSNFRGLSVTFRRMSSESELDFSESEYEQEEQEEDVEGEQEEEDEKEHQELPCNLVIEPVDQEVLFCLSA